jgi:hypothetical protein
MSAVPRAGAVLDFDDLIDTAQGVRHATERHEMRLFTHEEYLAALSDAGLAVEHGSVGVGGRGIYVGARTQSEP